MSRTALCHAWPISLGRDKRKVVSHSCIVHENLCYNEHLLLLFNDYNNLLYNAHKNYASPLQTLIN